MEQEEETIAILKLYSVSLLSVVCLNISRYKKYLNKIFYFQWNSYPH